MWNLAQYTYNQPASSSSLAIFWLVALIFAVVVIVAYWKIFIKAGQPGWKSIIPIYNLVTALNIVGMSGWYVLLFLLPFVGFFMAIYLAYKIAVAFGYGIGMTILEMIFGIGYLIIGFGEAKYLGPDGSGGNKAAAAQPLTGASTTNPPAQPATPPDDKPPTPPRQLIQ